jgi:fluoride exporter
MIWTLSQVALGGAIGSVARFASVMALTRLLGEAFPYGTALVNIAGSFAMGVLVLVGTR